MKHLSFGLLVFAVTNWVSSGAQAAAEPVRIELPAEQVLKLGAKAEIPVFVTADSSFSGTVALSLNLTEITQASPNGAVKLTITPNVLTLQAGQKSQALIEASVSTMAPTLNSVRVELDALATSPAAATHVSSQIAISVEPTFEIGLYGGPVPESWDSPKSVSFAPHAEGVLVRFINRDPEDSHIIHSVGPIPHGDTDHPLEPAPSMGQDGGVYEYRVIDTQKMKDIYYCHIHESGAQSRTLLFNQ